MIIATGLPVKFEQVDKDGLNEVISYKLSDGKVSQNRGTDSYIKSKSSTPKSVTLQKREQVRVLTIDPSTVLTPPKATDSLGCLVFNWLIARLKDLVELKVLDDWRIECKLDAGFRSVDLCQGNEYQNVLANETAFNKAKLGAQIKDSMISPKGVGALLRRFSFNYSSKRVDVGAKSGERVEIVRGFIEKESDFFRGAMARRLRAGTHLNEMAQKWLDKKAQEIAEYGAPLIPDRPVSPTTALLTIRHRIRRAMYITSDGHGGYKRDPDAVFRFEYIVNDLHDFVSRHEDVINKANLGAQVGEEGLTVKTVSLWDKAMGAELSSKKIDARKLLIYKDAKNANPDNTGGRPLLNGSKGEVDDPNKTAGVENNACKNNGLKTTKREWVRVYQVKQKCLQKMREIADSDKCEYMAEYYETIQNAAESTPIEPQDRPLKQRLGDFADEHRDEIFSLTHIAKTFGVEVDEVREAIRYMYDFKAIDHSQVRVLPKLIWSKLPYEPDEPDYPWLRDDWNDDDGIGGSLY
jgi:hypothetical protein